MTLSDIRERKKGTFGLLFKDNFQHQIRIFSTGDFRLDYKELELLDWWLNGDQKIIIIP